jgi:hypothetical protein
VARHSTPNLPVSLVSLKQLTPSTSWIAAKDQAMRKDIQTKVRETRKQLSHHLQEVQDAAQAEQQQEYKQLAILADYALGIQTALNFEGVSP